MKSMKERRDQDTELRKQAEELAQRKSAQLPEKQKGVSQEDISRLYHELQVHQIELEMQNEELRLAREELELSRNEYAELYDFAPVGYVTVDAHRRIERVNLTGAHLLGIERRLLLNKPFVNFIENAESREIYLKHLKEVAQQKGSQT